jgi:hypothetical protein
MRDLTSLYKEAKERFDNLEKELVDCYIDFLRKVAKYYLQRGRRVFFSENQVVHWGEGNFGWVLIEGNEETDQVFGEYISEIRFEHRVNVGTMKGYMEIKAKNLEDIRYEVLK